VERQNKIIIEIKMRASISAWFLVVLAAYEVDARLSGNRQVIEGFDGLQTTPPTSAYELLKSQTDAPTSNSLLGGGDQEEEIMGDNLYGTDTQSEPLLGGGGHGEQITDPNDFDEDGNAIYDSTHTGEGDKQEGTDFEDNDPDSNPLFGEGGHGQQITDPNDFDEYGNAIYGNNTAGEGDNEGTDGAFGDRFNGTDGDLNGNNGIDEEDGLGINDVDGFEGNSNVNGTDEGIYGGDNDGADESIYGNENNTDVDGANEPVSISDDPVDGDGDALDEDIDGDTNLDYTPSPAPINGGSNVPHGAGLPSYYDTTSRPSPTPFGSGPYGNNFGKPTFGQTSNTPSPTIESTTTTESPTSSPQAFVYIPPTEENLEQGQNDKNTGGKEDMQGEPSVGGTDGIGDYIYFDHAEPIDDMEHDSNVAIALGIVGGIGLCLAIITAQQTMENRNGCCASICRIIVSILCCPCRWICCCNRKHERYSNELISGGGYNQQYISDLELT